MPQRIPPQHKTPEVHVAEERRNRGALRRSPMIVPIPSRPTHPPTPVGFFHRGFEPRLEQCQDVTVADATGHRFQKLRVRDTIEIPAQVRIHHLRVPGIHQRMDVANRVLGTSTRPVGVLLRREVGLEDRLQDHHHRHLRHAVPKRADPKRPLLAVRLGDEHPTNRAGTIRAILEIVRQCGQPRARSRRFDVRERLTIDPGGAVVLPTALVGMDQNVPTVQLVVQSMEPIAGRFLRFGVQCRLELLNLFRRY